MILHTSLSFAWNPPNDGFAFLYPVTLISIPASFKSGSARLFTGTLNHPSCRMLPNLPFVLVDPSIPPLLIII